jgi:hypothetical protein
MQLRSAADCLRRLLPRNSLRPSFSLARLARSSATTSPSTQLQPPSHGHAAKARRKPRLRQLGIASSCRLRRGRHKEFSHRALTPRPLRAHKPKRRPTPPRCPVSSINRKSGHFRVWHQTDMSMQSSHVRCWGKSGSHCRLSR